MSISSEKSLCTSEDEDAQEKSSETRANENEEAQKNERSNLLCYLTKKMYPSDFRHWPILSLLKPEFTMRIRMIMVYGNGGNRALIVTQDKDVYTLDYNKDDHLETGDTHIGLCPKKIESLCGRNIKTFACNSYLVLAVTEEGEVYVWTFNNMPCILNDGSYVPIVLRNILCKWRSLSENCIVDIACGTDHFLALTSDGRVFAWGVNQYGQIGNGNTNNVNVMPTQVKHELEGKKVVSIACGSKFNMVITDKGKLYGWGDNYYGQISSHVNCYRCYTTSKPLFDSSVFVKVACGSEHTLALTLCGKIYAWGMNDNGQVGANNNKKISASVMVNLPKKQKVLDIAACGNLSVAVGSDKTVYVWGECFGEIITTPFPTGFSRIHDAFAFSTRSVMHKPLTVSMNNDDEKVLNLVESLETLFDDPSTSNFTVQVEGQPIYVHKAILKNRCQYFKNKFEHDWTENDQNVPYTVLDKFSYIIYKAFLKYLYIGAIDLPSKQVLELMQLADEYCETNLKRECNRVTKQAITALNVAFFYDKAIECNAKITNSSISVILPRDCIASFSGPEKILEEMRRTSGNNSSKKNQLLSKSRYYHVNII